MYRKPGIFSIILTSLLCFMFSPSILAGPKEKKPSKAPSAYQVFLQTLQTKKSLSKSLKDSAEKTLKQSIERPGYILNDSENAPTDTTALAKWLREKDRTGLRFDVTIEKISMSLKDKKEIYTAMVRATLYTHPSGWLVMSTSGRASAVSDDWSSEEELKQRALEAAMKGVVENIVAHLTKNPIPIDR